MVAFIKTKLQKPVIGPDILPRSHLIERLKNGRHRKLTLISAPAGYGKSTLASILAKECSRPAAWLSLDENDNDLGTFVNYVINAVQIFFPKSFPQTTELLNGQQLPSPEIISTHLIIDANAIAKPFIIFLDDFHKITNTEINQLVGTLVQYLPAHIHLVIATRQDPPLAIVNLRANNQLNEIRLNELRFSELEVEQYLKHKLGDDISRELASELFKLTEGWAVGLHLAILATKNDVDQVGFIGSLKSADQHIMSYLLNEILSQQPQFVQSFLLQTSIFDRFSAALCDTVCLEEDAEDRNNSRTILDKLVDNNLFIVPLDQQGEWYRYHQLFQDLLRHQLSARFPKDIIKRLHIRASTWFANHGFLDEALDHAFLGSSVDQPVHIVAQARYDLMNRTRWQRLEQLLSRFPQDVVDSSPDLLMARIWLFYQHFQWIKLPAAFEQLEKLIGSGTRETKEYKYLEGEISALRSLLFYHALDIDGVVTHAQRALEQTAPELGIVRAFTRMMLAGTHLWAGDLRKAYAAVYLSFDEEPVQSDILKATILVTSCFVGWVAADMNTVKKNAAQVINLSQEPRSPGMLGYGHYFLGMVNYHQNDLSAAETHFSFVNERPYTVYNDAFVYGACGLALTYQALGREREALDVVDKATAYALQSGNSAMLAIVEALQADLALRQGHLSAAVYWAKQNDPPPPLSPMTQFYAPHVILARVWLAENTPTSREKAMALLVELRSFLESTHNSAHLIETLALLALCQHKNGDESTALDTIKQALILGLPGNFIRPFVDLGPDLEKLLLNLTLEKGELAAYKEKVLAAMDPAGKKASEPLDSDDSQTHVEALTNREMDVLILLGQRRTDREIAQELLISHHTVRTHTKNIYAKLGVSNRHQAAVRAQELGLLTTS